MGPLPTYHDLNEKRLAFNETTVNDLNVLIDLLRQFENNPDRRLIFRGIDNAKYKLYNSGQRYWSTLNEDQRNGVSYQGFIENLILNAQSFHDGLLRKFFNSFGQSSNSYDLPTLSFLQHYGAPTPFLDWTYNVYTALFFSTGKGKTTIVADSEIDEYFSLYYIEVDPDRRSEKYIPNFLTTIDSNARIAEIANDIHDLIKYFGKELTEKIQTLKYSFLNENQLLMIPGYTEEGFKFTINNAPGVQVFYNQHNFNVIAQEGLFVFNANELHPLEYLFQNRPVIETDVKFNLPHIGCTDIHKSLLKDVKRILNQPSIGKNKKMIYPTGELIAENAVKKFTLRNTR